MKITLYAASIVSIFLASSAMAQERQTPDPELLCLEELEVNRTAPIVREVLPRARVQADEPTNCFVVIGRPDRVAVLRDLLRRMEVRARSRRQLENRRAAIPSDSPPRSASRVR